MEKILSNAQWLEQLLPSNFPTDNYTQGVRWLKERGFEELTVDSFTSDKDKKEILNAERIGVYYVKKIIFKGESVTAKLNLWCSYKEKNWHVSLITVVEKNGCKDGGERGEENSHAPKVDAAIAKLRMGAEYIIAKAGKNPTRVTVDNFSLEK